jgi:beta-glucanase (GH16 family)
MKKNIIILGLAFFLFSCPGEKADPDLYSKINDPRWRLVWSDEFAYQGKPDAEKWAFNLGGNGWGNSELQYYTDRPRNVEVRDGKLVITSRKEEYENKYYTSARLKTAGLAEWQYGRFEIYAKLPEGKGIWTALWLLPASYPKIAWPLCGEIDLMENVGQEPGKIYGTVHTAKYNHRMGTHKTGSVAIQDCYQNFHLYALEWTPNEIVWYADGEEYFRFIKEADDPEVWPFNAPFFLIMNVSVGGGFGGSVDDDIFPTELLVDYVRVFKLPG